MVGAWAWAAPMQAKPMAAAPSKRKSAGEKRDGIDFFFVIILMFDMQS
jgi:hypothetical protein